MRLPPLPELDWKDDAPFAMAQGDVYFSGDGLSEKKAVFLGGCGLPEAWAGRELFTIGELGFGTGLNLLALWEAWRAARPSKTARLEVLSFEGALIRAEDAARVHARWPELDELSRELRARWPTRARGMQRIALGDGVTLTLAVDDVAAALPQARARVDAWFLDGFAPSKNPEMWTADVMREVARLSAPGVRVASYAVAGAVRRNLEAAGFAVEKKPGHGRKKERLEAVLRTPEQDPHLIPTALSTAGAAPPPFGGGRPVDVAIIGAGVAGACAAHSFLRRGCRVTVYDKAHAGAGASGNPLALVMPRLDSVDGPGARGLVEAYLHARRFYRELGAEAAVELAAEHRPRGEKENLRFAKLMLDPPLDESLLRMEGGNLKHIGAIAVRPAEALRLLLAGAEMRLGTDVRSVAEIEADLVVVCAGMGTAGIAGADAPPLTGRLGQLERAASDGAAGAVADGGYAVEAFGQLVFGATFEPAEGEPHVSVAARAQNLETLARLRPGFAPGELTSRAAIRATTQDRFPFAGRPYNEKAPGGDPAPLSSVRLVGGLGARGFLWAPLLAEIVATEVLGEPSPVEASVAADLDPGRFTRRAIRRGG
ncbi:MAG TPA: tRNA (5-methylaminomethyl-2-thiouridine)(34)-methyltransferase MnmD [Hyphomonadaceae bacterium]|nr:tRNA (5-methylaminomethyl-2-thiouridine)(34)-methyltransferase MnmD [Hyphomonadaceae bacterium]